MLKTEFDIKEYVELEREAYESNEDGAGSGEGCWKNDERAG